MPDVEDSDNIVVGEHEEDAVSAAPLAVKKLPDLSSCFLTLRRKRAAAWEVFQGIDRVNEAVEPLDGSSGPVSTWYAMFRAQLLQCFPCWPSLALLELGQPALNAL